MHAYLAIPAAALIAALCVVRSVAAQEVAIAPTELDVAAGDTPGDATSRHDLTLRDVIQEAVAHHPDLAVSTYDAAIVATDEERVAGQVNPGLNASVGVRDDRQPTVSDFQPSETRLGQASATLSKPLASGATLSIGADYSRTRQEFDSPFAAQLAKVNPAYRGGISLSYRHPLLQGADRPTYTAGLTAARADADAAELQRQVVARNLSLTALNLYFTLRSDYVGVALAQSGVARAQKFLDYQQLREKYGLIEEADRLQAEALLATRRFDLQTAHAHQREDEAGLNRLMQRAANAPLHVTVARRGVSARDDTVDDGLRDAMKRRPEFKIIDAQLAAAEARLRIARDADRSRVDLVAEFGTQSLDGDAIDAAGGAFAATDRFAGLSVEVTDTLGRDAAKADRRRAEFTRGRIVAQRRQLTEQVRDELVASHTTLVTGEQTLRAARDRVAAERQKFNAELERYREGRSTTATLVQFENDLNTAELQAELQQLAVNLADWQFAWSAGTLGEELNLTLSSAVQPASSEPETFESE